MRSFLTWILVLGLLAGAGARASAGAIHPVEDSCARHSAACHGVPQCENFSAAEDSGGTCDAHGCQHHHHCCCAHGQPLTMERETLQNPGLRSTRAAVVRDGDSPPEEPVLGCEKPPQI